MTIASTTRRNDYVGNGTTATYSYGFKIFANTDLRVTVKDADDVETELTLTTHYIVSGVGDTSGGSITLINGSFDWIDGSGYLETGHSLTIRRVRPLTQNTDIRNQGEYFPEEIENEFDRGVMIAQQQQDEIDRSLKFPETSTTDADVAKTVPDPEANKVLGWNATADGLENKTLSYTSGTFPGSFTAGTDAAKPASPTTNDVYLATDSKILYVCYSSGTWTVTTILSGTDAAKPASPKAGQAYLATDIKKLYKCYVAGTWTTIENGTKGSDIASATTTDIGAATGEFVDITGTTTITGLGTIGAGAIRKVRFTGALTLTHNATSLILPGAANITTAANDTAEFVSLGSGNWVCTSYKRASGLSVVSGLPKNYLDGGIISNNATDATNDLDVSAAVCRSDDNAEDISVGDLTKRIDAAWASGTNQGMMDTGSIGASADLIYLFAIKNTSSGATDVLASKSASSPTMPSGYTKKRLIGARRWTGSAWAKFKTSGNDRDKFVMYDDGVSVLSGGTSTSFADVDCGDGGGEAIPSTARKFLCTIRSLPASGTNSGCYFRLNGSSAAVGDSNLFQEFQPLSSHRTIVTSTFYADSDGIFEYAVVTNGSVSIYIQGYEENL